MKEKLHIAITRCAGILTHDITRLLPGLRLSAELETLPDAADGGGAVPDVLIAGLSEYEAVQSLNNRGVVLLLGEQSEVEQCMAACVHAGILFAERENFNAVFPLAAAMAVRLRPLRARESSLQRQLTDTKLVTRAKLLLMTRLQMSESEAHRYIEKTAMDNGESRRNVALRLIRTYEE